MNKYEQALKQFERVPGIVNVLEIDGDYGDQDSNTRDDYLADIQDILKSFKGEKGKDDLKKLHNELKTMVESWSTDWTINRDQMKILTDLVFNQIVQAGKNIDKNFEQSLTESPKKKSGGFRSPFAAIREKLKGSRNKDEVVVEVGRVAEETTVFVELYDPSQNPRLSVELDSLSDDSIELSTDLEKTKADPEKKKTALKSLSTLRESISKKQKSSFSDKIFELAEAVAQPVRSSTDFAKIDALISKTNDPEKINAAYNRLREELLKVEKNPELHYESYERRAKDIMGKLASKMAVLNSAQKDSQLQASVDRLASATKKAASKKDPKKEVKPLSKFGKEFDKVIKNYDNADFMQKDYPKILKLIANATDITALQDALERHKPRPDDFDVRNNIMQAVYNRIDAVKWGPLGGVSVDQQENKSADRVKLLDRFKGISSRFRKVAKEAENLSSDNQSAEEKAEIARIQEVLDGTSQEGTQALSDLAPYMDPDHLLEAGSVVEVVSDSVDASEEASVVASSKKGLNSQAVQNFKKGANDVGARIREKLFPFEATLEKLANKHAVASGKKQEKIEATIDKLIDSNNDWLPITRVLRNLVDKNDDRLDIVIGKLELKAAALDPTKKQTGRENDESFATADLTDNSDSEALQNLASQSPNPDESLDTADITYTSDIHELRAIIEDLAAITEARQSAQVPREKQETKESPQVQLLVDALVEKAKTFVKGADGGNANVVKDFQDQAKELIRNILKGKIDPEIIKMAVAKIRDEKKGLGNDASRASLFDGLGNIVSALQTVVPPAIPPKPHVQPRVPKFAEAAKASARTAVEEGKVKAQDGDKEPPLSNK